MPAESTNLPSTTNHHHRPADAPQAQTHFLRPDAQPFFPRGVGVSGGNGPAGPVTPPDWHPFPSSSSAPYCDNRVHQVSQAPRFHESYRQEQPTVQQQPRQQSTAGDDDEITGSNHSEVVLAPFKDLSEVVLVPFKDLSVQDVGHLGKCVISNVRAYLHMPNETYYNRNQTKPIVTGVATMEDGSSHPIQRIMIGQIPPSLLNQPGLGAFAIGKLLAYITNEKVTIYQLTSQKNKPGEANPHKPAMVGCWVRISSGERLDLQRATILFSNVGVIAAFNNAQHIRILEIADWRRQIGNSGLPESPMTIEAAHTPPNNRETTHGSVYQFFPPKNHPYPNSRGGFRPFITRWNEECSPFSDEYKPEGYEFTHVEEKDLKQWQKKIIKRLQLVKLTEDDENFVVYEAEENGSNIMNLN